jgi:mxaC protein
MQFAHSFDLLHAPLLLLLPLALLPWINTRSDALAFSHNPFLPRDNMARWLDRLWRGLASAAMVTLVLGLAGPGKSSQQIERIGRGSEISILLDRSASMDANIRRNLPEPWEAARASQSKSEVVRGALLDLLEQRPGNRYALTLFNIVATRVSPFTDDVELIRAGLEATAIGRGPSETNMGLAILAAIESFEGRPYTGSRAIVLVSDGGARLEESVQEKISAGLKQFRISLYFVYIQSSPNSPDLERVGLQSDSTVEEVELHLFFRGLGVDYHVYQANDPESMAKAVTQIDAQQNLPLTYLESVPRIDYSRQCFAIALVGCLLISAFGATRMERWT